MTQTTRATLPCHGPVYFHCDREWTQGATCDLVILDSGNDRWNAAAKSMHLHDLHGEPYGPDIALQSHGRCDKCGIPTSSITPEDPQYPPVRSWEEQEAADVALWTEVDNAETELLDEDDTDYDPVHTVARIFSLDIDGVEQDDEYVIPMDELPHVRLDGPNRRFSE